MQVPSLLDFWWVFFLFLSLRVGSVKSDSAASWTVALQVPLSMGFSRQEYGSGLPFPLPDDLPNLKAELMSRLLYCQEALLLQLLLFISSPLFSFTSLAGNHNIFHIYSFVCNNSHKSTDFVLCIAHAFNLLCYRFLVLVSLDCY